MRISFQREGKIRWMIKSRNNYNVRSFLTFEMLSSIWWTFTNFTYRLHSIFGGRFQPSKSMKTCLERIQRNAKSHEAGYYMNFSFRIINGLIDCLYQAESKFQPISDSVLIGPIFNLYSDFLTLMISSVIAFKIFFFLMDSSLFYQSTRVFDLSLRLE